jgi:hypothetical protein
MIESNTTHDSTSFTAGLFNKVVDRAQLGLTWRGDYVLFPWRAPMRGPVPEKVPIGLPCQT